MRNNSRLSISLDARFVSCLQRCSNPKPLNLTHTEKAKDEKSPSPHQAVQALASRSKPILLSLQVELKHLKRSFSPPIFKRFCITFGFLVKKHGDLSTPIADCWAKTQACPMCCTGKMQEWKWMESGVQTEAPFWMFNLKYPQQELSWLCSKNLQAGPMGPAKPYAGQALDSNWWNLLQPGRTVRVVCVRPIGNSMKFGIERIRHPTKCTCLKQGAQLW